MKVAVSTSVNAAIRAIVAYYDQLERRDIADRVSGELEATMRKLAKYQYHRRTSDDLPDRFRRVISGYYIIYYEVDQKANTVYVYEVRYGARKPLAPGTHRRLASRAHKDSIELS